MGDDRRFGDCCDNDFRDRCHRDCCDKCCDKCCCDNGGNGIWMIILIIVILCLFCGDNNSGGLFGGLF